MALPSAAEVAAAIAAFRKAGSPASIRRKSREYGVVYDIRPGEPPDPAPPPAPPASGDTPPVS
ncbi:MAG: hypothetical protein JO117_01310 [Verrucomicrobia bacterium]|nr:hypothetical protein [Verrucomicrobiota bacterium]